MIADFLKNMNVFNVEIFSKAKKKTISQYGLF